ncbi:MAG: LysR substrate-binding domain-containing protein, partial [Pseudomonadota bacterium]|nr:LysR substrate-binding domain-containing protein [Pseudomonadota bacterium]
TTMMIQLVASGRGLVCLPNWALHEHVEKNYVVAKSLGEEGVWPNLYAAVRPDQASVPFIASFVETAKKTCFATLVGIVPADEDVAASETNLE